MERRRAELAQLSQAWSRMQPRLDEYESTSPSPYLPIRTTTKSFSNNPNLLDDVIVDDIGVMTARGKERRHTVTVTEGQVQDMLNKSPTASLKSSYCLDDPMTPHSVSYIPSGKTPSGKSVISERSVSLGNQPIFVDPDGVDSYAAPSAMLFPRVPTEPTPDRSVKRRQRRWSTSMQTSQASRFSALLDEHRQLEADPPMTRLSLEFERVDSIPSRLADAAGDEEPLNDSCEVEKDG
jgi:hypothetical protein